MIQRHNISELVEIMEYFPVLGLVGPRQVGKTTLAKELSQRIQKESIYIDLENPRDEVKLTDPVLFFQNNIDKCVILDEIQRKPELFPILRSMIDEKREAGRFLILGSASPDLIRDSSESLAGRIAYEELAPFNLTEIHNHKNESSHWINGGFPDAFLAPNDKIRKKWLQNFIQTYVERDLPLIGLDVNPVIIRKLWIMTAHLHGNVLNMTTLGKALELTSTTIKKYLSFLENAFLIRQLQPYSVNIKKRVVKSPKIFVRDSGILHYLLNIENNDVLMSHPMVGNSWEGYVIEQIYHLLSNEYDFHFYRTHEGAECDLVLIKSGIPHYGIEIKYTSTPKLTRGTYQAFEDLETKENFVITPNTDDYMLKKDIRVCSLEKFLNHYAK